MHIVPAACCTCTSAWLLLVTQDHTDKQRKKRRLPQGFETQLHDLVDSYCAQDKHGVFYPKPSTKRSKYRPEDSAKFWHVGFEVVKATLQKNFSNMNSADIGRAITECVCAEQGH
jgi:hypothetical protein